jgi:hypothetical protein
MLKIILFFVALAIVIYFFDRSIIPKPLEHDPSAVALAEKIAKCNAVYGTESTRKKQFSDCQNNCSKRTDDSIRVCIDACQAIADQFSNCANQAMPAK